MGAWYSLNLNLKLKSHQIMATNFKSRLGLDHQKQDTIVHLMSKFSFILKLRRVDLLNASMSLGQS